MGSAPARAPAGWPREAEAPVPGPVPRLELAAWRELGIVAGITARGAEAGRGFDLGLWGDAPVGDVMGRWRALRQVLESVEAMVLGNQVHGREVVTVGPARGWLQLEGVDGWVTTTPGTYLAVTVADCIPVYLAVPGRGIALLHAGWRGTAAGILEAGLEQLCRATHATGSDVIMHCGVGICGSCYEVGSEVMTGCGLAPEGAGPWHLDLREALAARASRGGVERITLSTWCSAHDRPRFHSHRASRGADGRMVAYLGMPKN